MTPISIVGANQIFVHKTCLYVMIVVSLSLSLIISHALLPMLIVKLLTEQNQVSASGWSSDYILSLCLLLHAFSFWQINWSELTFRQRCTANLSVKASPVSEMLTSISPENPENYYSRWPAGTRCLLHHAHILLVMMTITFWLCPSGGGWLLAFAILIYV